MADTQEVPTSKLQDFHVTNYMMERLHKVAINEGFKNYHLDIDHGSKIGDGFIGVILKVKIQEIDSNKYLLVLAKVPPESTVRREILRSMDFFERECLMYNVVLPEFIKFQREMGISEEKGFFNFPKVYLADFTPDDSIIIMQDLRDFEYKNWNKYKSMDYEHASLIMSTLGRFHAISFAMKIKRPEVFKELSCMKEVFFKFRSEKSVERMKNMCQKLAEVAPENDEIRQILNEIDKVVLECVNPQLAEPFAVITHGDPWTNNFLFHHDKNGHPDDLMIIDWQVSRYSSPILDLVYFIFISTDKNLRKNYYNELLNVYHRSFINLCTYLEVEKASMEFSFDELQKQLTRFGKFGMILASFVVPITQAKKDEIPDFDITAETIKKENNSKSIFGLEHKHKEIDEMIRDIINDATEYGYL